MEYDKFLKTKLNYGNSIGFDIKEVSPVLFDFQQAIVKWSLKKGRCAIFADTGLGKTLMQLEWAKNIIDKTKGKIIIVAPLSVNEQTIDEGKDKLNLKIENWENITDSNIHMINYESIHKINFDDYTGIVLDESSILKSINSKTREQLIKSCMNIKYKLCCTATPCPNDISELANHTEFLGILKREEMLAKWFFHDNCGDWSIKGYAENDFYKWMSTWAFFIKKPSDIGFEDNNFKLKKLTIEPLYFDYEFKKEGFLFSNQLHGLEDRLKIRNQSIKKRIEEIKALINNSDEQWIVWTALDEEANQLSKVLNDGINLEGKNTKEDKIEKIRNFKNKKIRVLISKPKILGFGMNFQNCHNVLFFGLSDSYESYYQCIRRCWRFGQKKDVKVYITLAGNESVILSNVIKKEQQSENISNQVIKHIKDFERQEIMGSIHQQTNYNGMMEMQLPKWI